MPAPDEDGLPHLENVLRKREYEEVDTTLSFKVAKKIAKKIKLLKKYCNSQDSPKLGRGEKTTGETAIMSWEDTFLCPPGFAPRITIEKFL